MQRHETPRPSGAPLLAAAGLLVGLSIPGHSPAAAGQPVEDDTLEWLGDYQEALALAKETGRPLLVEFRCSP